MLAQQLIGRGACVFVSNLAMQRSERDARSCKSENVRVRDIGLRKLQISCYGDGQLLWNQYQEQRLSPSRDIPMAETRTW